MSLEKLGDIYAITNNETTSGITGNGTSEPLGVDDNSYSVYNEKCLFSSIYSRQTGALSDDFTKYQRLRLRVGWHNNSTTTNESDSYIEVTPEPTAGANVAAIWNVGTGTPGYICVGRVNFPTTTSFNGTVGKLMQFDGNVGVTGWEGRLRPIKEVWGINKQLYKFFALSSEGGSLESNKLLGYRGDTATLTAIPESEVWKCSAINISGATLTGNNFTFENSNVTAQAEFEHSRELTIEPTAGGVITANLNSGFSGDVITLGVDSTNEGYKFSSYNVTGSEATGNDIMFTGSDITAQGNFEHSRDLTLENGEHGVLSADKMTGFIGDVVTVDATTDEGWYLSAIALTGAEATGFKFMFTGSDVTALGEYTDVGFPITYLSDEHVSVTGDTTIFIPGSEGITLDSGYDDYYRISGYDITNGSIIDGKLVPTGPCTIKAVETLNYFTATGNFEQGSNVNVTAGSTAAKSTNVPAKYALYVGHTGDIPASWYETSNRWKPNSASAYSITLNTKMSFSISGSNTIYSDTKGELTAGSLIGSTLTQTAVSSRASKGIGYYYYNKTFTSTAQNVNYGVSAKLYAVGYYYYHPDVGTMQTKFDTKYYSSGTNGTWTATGIAP